jgi:hypothetical protein
MVQLESNLSNNETSHFPPTKRYTNLWQRSAHGLEHADQTGLFRPISALIVCDTRFFTSLAAYMPFEFSCADMQSINRQVFSAQV